MAASAILALVFLSASVQAAEPRTRLGPLPGSKVRIEGTSSIHDWQVESALIGGSLEVGPEFPTEPSRAVKPGKMNVTADVFIPAHSLKSIEKDGRPYSDSMDDIMYGKLLAPEHPRIAFHLDELVLKEAPATTNAPYAFEATGDLAVAGKTNKVTLPVDVMPLGNRKLKISGHTAVKMTDFGIQPPAPAVALGLIKTGDEVKLSFEWMVGPRTPDGKTETGTKR
jgi:YceI-like domain